MNSTLHINFWQVAFFPLSLNNTLWGRLTLSFAAALCGSRLWNRSRFCGSSPRADSQALSKVLLPRTVLPLYPGICPMRTYALLQGGPQGMRLYSGVYSAPASLIDTACRPLRWCCRLRFSPAGCEKPLLSFFQIVIFIWRNKKKI